MQIAAFLSDLKSLSACPHDAAITLVSIYKQTSNTDSTSNNNDNPSQESNDPAADEDTTRATELITLHQNVKLKHLHSGPDFELLQARQDVAKVLAALHDEI